MFGSKTEMISPDKALPGRDTVMSIAPTHVVLGTPLVPPFPAGIEHLYLGLGCFWGAERIFWKLPGVYVTAVGYMGGWTKNPTYEETCTSRTGHTETVMVVYDPAKVDFDLLMKAFWENHDPTTANRQGNDVGTQYRSAIFTTTDAQLAAAEDYHQGYLHKHPGGYCNHGFCQIGYDLAAHGQGVARAVLPES